MASKHHIVGLDAWVVFDSSLFTFEHTSHIIRDGSALTNPEQLKDATIVVNSATPIRKDLLRHMPKLQLIAGTGAGTDHIDKDFARARGITVTNVPAQNTETVSEHAFALASALKRRIMPMHQVTIEGKKWAEVRGPHLAFGKPPRTNSEETLVSCVIGYGALGQQIERIGKALGMKVIIAERKNASSIREGRTSFPDAIHQATMIFVVCPRDNETIDMISTPELEAMDSTVNIVNTGRGGVVNEEAVAQALKDGKIGGFATDVYAIEPATRESSILLDETIPNLILSPHIAWYSSRTLNGTVEVLKDNIEGFVSGKPQNVL